jgi:hypothetical protein
VSAVRKASSATWKGAAFAVLLVWASSSIGALAAEVS